MAFELVSVRVFAPWFGASQVVWTALIGVILAFMTLGYFLGGKRADRTQSPGPLALWLSVAAVWISLIPLVDASVCRFALHLEWPFVMCVLLVAVLFLSVPALCLGMVTPYGIRMCLEVKPPGRTIGNLYALSSLGSIVGVFVGGWWLVPTLGYAFSLQCLAGLLLVAGLLLAQRWWSWALILLAILAVVGERFLGDEDRLEFDTAYNHVWIYEGGFEGYSARIMQVNDEFSSAMYHHDPAILATTYPRYFRLVEHFQPDFRKTLLLGGGGYEYPRFFLKQYPEATLDVVEIDPGLTALAREHLQLQAHPALRIHHEDGRTFVQRTHQKYDLIVMDAFRSHSIPSHLTSVEMVRALKSRLSDQGMVITSLLSEDDTDPRGLLQRLYATYSDVFETVLTFRVQDSDNIMLVAFPYSNQILVESVHADLNALLQDQFELSVDSNAIVIEDNFAPEFPYLPKVRG